jgi:hypothetical protein
MDVLHYNRPMTHFRCDAAELIFSAFGTIEISKAYNDSPDLAKAINCEVIKSEAHAPLGVFAYCVGDTEVFRTNLN